VCTSSSNFTVTLPTLKVQHAPLRVGTGRAATRSHDQADQPSDYNSFLLSLLRYCVTSLLDSVLKSNVLITRHPQHPFITHRGLIKCDRMAPGPEGGTECTIPFVVWVTFLPLRHYRSLFCFVVSCSFIGLDSTAILSFTKIVPSR
jgi:hypothetical protein